MNETVCEDGRIERRSAYGGDAFLVLSQIHSKKLREQRRGETDLHFGTFSSISMFHFLLGGVFPSHECDGCNKR